MNQKLEIDRTLVCSTAHLTEADARALTRGVGGLIYYETGEYGWIVLVYFAVGADGIEISSTFRDVLNFARAADCDWIRFDRDGDVIEGMATFEW